MISRVKRLVYDLIGIPLGNLLIFLFPKKAEKLGENRITLVHMNKKNLSLSERLIRVALINKLDELEDFNAIAEANREFWIKKGPELFKEIEDGFENDFLPNCTFIFDLLKKEMTLQPKVITTLVEIGTGNGDVLNYLSYQYTEIERFVGIDLSPLQIEMNIKRFRENKKLEFIAMDAVDWVREYGESNMIFITSKGVLEYFLEKELQDFLIQIYQLGFVYFVAIEPNGPDHDFDREPRSKLHGKDPSFSHNYPLLFRNAGFTLWHFSQQPWVGGRTKRTFIGAKS